MLKQKRESSSFCASQGKRHKQIQRQDSDKQQQENGRQHDQHQLASRELTSETREDQVDKRRQRDVEAHRLACPDSKRRIEEQQHYTAARRQARQDHATRREEQQRNTAAHQLAMADPQYRAHEQQTSNARRQQVSTSRLPSLMALNYHPDNFSYTA